MTVDPLPRGGLPVPLAFADTMHLPHFSTRSRRGRSLQHLYPPHSEHLPRVVIFATHIGWCQQMTTVRWTYGMNVLVAVLCLLPVTVPPAHLSTPSYPTCYRTWRPHTACRAARSFYSRPLFL